MPDADGLYQLANALTAMSVEMAASNERSIARERFIDRLFEENERLRAGERMMILRPLAFDLQRLRNDLLRQAASLPVELSITQMTLLLQSFAFSAEQALERCGVQVIHPRPGDQFDPTWHSASGIDPAPSAEHDGVISAVLADGYIDGVDRRAMTAATVRVYRWLPAQPADPASISHAEVPAQSHVT